MQVEVWVQLSDPLGFILDSKPYLAPLITPYEAITALSDEPLPQVLQLGDLTAITAELQARQEQAGDIADSTTQELSLLTTGLQLGVQHGGPGRQQLAVQSGAQYLAVRRTYQGLEAPVAGAAPKAPAPAVEGRAGRAAGYSQEGDL
jgi:diphthamide biosynthesis protein 2